MDCGLALGLLLVAVVGCSSQPRIKLAPVRGQITLAGKVLPQVTVQLVADQKKGTSAPPGMGQTDADGKFVISTPPHGDGAEPGHYKVMLISYGGDVPERYTDPRLSPLEIEVPEGGLEDWKMELTP